MKKGLEMIFKKLEHIHGARQKCIHTALMLVKES